MNLPPRLSACLLALLPLAAWAAADAASTNIAANTPHDLPAADAPARLVGAREYALHSPETGRTYRIQVSAIGKPPPGGYPVLYALDGEALFPIVSLAAQSMILRAAEHQATPLLIVGIGYFDDDRADGTAPRLLAPAARAEDYTPPSADYRNTGDKRNPRFGGAEKFHRFLTGPLRADIARRFRIDPARQSLLGHSYGGLFGVYVLLNHPASFRRYLLASPSLWWNGQRVLQDWEKFRTSPRPPIDVRLSVDEYEQTTAPHLPAREKRQAVLEERGMVRNVQRFGQQLAALAGLAESAEPAESVEPAEASESPGQAASQASPGGKISAIETAIYPRETHATSLMPAINDGLKWLFARERADSAANAQRPARGDDAGASRSD